MANGDLPNPPKGVGTYGSLVGVIAAIAAFLTGWAKYGLTPEVITLAATAGGVLAAWFLGRSNQAAALYRDIEPVITQVRGAIGQTTETITEELSKKEPPPEIVQSSEKGK